ncbi:511_t:CDS:2, partial [Funneliformis geosporum]
YVAEKCFYHYRDASFNTTIINMAQAFPGIQKFPYFTGIRQFENCHNGQKAEPQYLIPVMSTTVLESFKIVSEGWNYQNFDQDMQNTLAQISSLAKKWELRSSC